MKDFRFALQLSSQNLDYKNFTTRSKIAPEGSRLRQNQKCNVDYSQYQIVWHHFKKTKSFLKFRLLTKPHLLLYLYQFGITTLPTFGRPHATDNVSNLNFIIRHQGRWIEFCVELAQQVSIIFIIYKVPNLCPSTIHLRYGQWARICSAWVLKERH